MYERYCDICRNKIEEDSEDELMLETYDLCKDCRKKIKRYINQLKDQQKGGINKMQDIKKSNTIIKKYWDDWIDEKGMLHTKFVMEVIRGPITNAPESQYVHLTQVSPKLMMKKIILQPQGLPKMNLPMDIGSLMQVGKNFLESSGINLKDVLGEITKAVKQETEEEDEDFPEYVPVPTEEEENTAKKELDKIIVPETKPKKKPSKTKKEVNKKWQKTQKTKQQNQKKKLQQKK